MGTQTLVFTMHLLLLSGLLASATAATSCDNCQAVVDTLAAYLTSDESVMRQQEMLVPEICPGAENPAECESGLPDFWKSIALVLWPNYYNSDPQVTTETKAAQSYKQLSKAVQSRRNIL